MKRVAILISGGGSNMVRLAEDMTGDHPARPVLVASNDPSAAGLARAAAMGIPVVAVKIKVFALSAALGGLSGALYAHYVTFISPERFHLHASFELLLAALLGGSGTPYGAVAGAVLLVVLPEVVAPLRDYKVAVYGVVFILVSLYMPRGIAGAFELIRRPGARRASPAASPTKAESEA